MEAGVALALEVALPEGGTLQREMQAGVVQVEELTLELLLLLPEEEVVQGVEIQLQQEEVECQPEAAAQLAAEVQAEAECQLRRQQAEPEQQQHGPLA